MDSLRVYWGSKKFESERHRLMGRPELCSKKTKIAGAYKGKNHELEQNKLFPLVTNRMWVTGSKRSG